MISQIAPVSDMPVLCVIETRVLLRKSYTITLVTVEKKLLNNNFTEVATLKVAYLRIN